MDNGIEHVRLYEIASAIKGEGDEFLNALRSSAERAARIGNLLLEAKPLLRRRFKQWCVDNTPYNYRRCADFVRIAKGAELCTFESDASVGSALRMLSGEKKEAESVGGPAWTDAVSDLHALVASGAKFGTVYADPAWKYDNQGTRAATSKHYRTMTVDEIAALPVAQLVTERSHLHLWTTNAFLFDAKRVMEAWGFDYRGSFVWVKPKIGIGNYWRVSHEFLLLGVRGTLPFVDKSQKSWLEADRLGHSHKPEAVRNIIEKTSPSPYLELFGRREIEGWVVWGNEIERDLLVQASNGGAPSDVQLSATA